MWAQPGVQAGDGGTTIVSAPRNFAQIQEQVIQPGCTFSVCHATHGAPNANQLDFTRDAYAALFGKPSEHARAKQEGKLRIDPCKPDDSFFYRKLMSMSGADSQGYGDQMPESNPPLAEVQLQGPRHSPASRRTFVAARRC